MNTDRYEWGVENLENLRERLQEINDTTEHAVVYESKVDELIAEISAILQNIEGR